MTVVIDSTLVLAVIASGCASAQPRPRAAVPPSRAAQLEAATREIYEAIPKGDRAVWERWLAHDFMLLDRDGKVQDRAAVLADFNPLPPTIQLRLDIENLVFRDLGPDAGLVAFLVRETETIFGQTIHVDYQTSLTFARRDGQWKLIVFQYVELPRDATPVAVEPARLAAYAGEYAADAATKFIVSVRDGKLFGRREGKSEVELVPEADGVFYVPGTEFRKIFVRDRAGTVIEMIDRRKGTDIRWRRIST